MDILSVSTLDLRVVEEFLSKTNELNAGFDVYDRTCFQITNGNSSAYAIVYDLSDECPELARFFVPIEYRNAHFGKLAAVFLMNHLFETRSQLLIEPINDSIGFWVKVAELLSGRVEYENVDYPKGIWKKI
ncbi:TPA: hypothetical protein I7778_21605 [Vibrio vulnificus]|nr:hypothetical protein [Vibrio vulnificus]